MARWEFIMIWCLRAAVLVTGAIFMVEGEWTTGVFCGIAVLLAITPTLVVRSGKVAWPFEIELVLLWFLLVHFTLGHLFHLYTRIVWFDKTLHFGDSVVIGFVAFMAVYAAHFLRRDRPHPVLDGLAILIATLGFGALWEICEFTSDHLFGTHAQGSPIMSPLVDTMWDLILDGCGGVIGAIVGSIYIHQSRRSRQRVAQFAMTADARIARAAGRAGMASVRPLPHAR